MTSLLDATDLDIYNPVDENEFDAFGNGGANDYSRMGYAGQYHDAETGFVYLRARYYNPAIGRFINEDPIRDGLNWYVYCGNDPVNFVDPTGLVLQMSSDATEEEIDEYNRAIEYLKTSDTGRSLIEKLENAEAVFTIVFSNNPEKTQYSPVDQTITWAPFNGHIMSDGASVQSASIALAHEMGHAAQYLDGELEFALQDGEITSEERYAIESNNLEKYESPIARELSEPTRANYFAVLGNITMTNSTNYVTINHLRIKCLQINIKYLAIHNFFPLTVTRR